MCTLHVHPAKSSVDELSYTSLHGGVGKWGVSSDYAEVPVSLVPVRVSLVKWAGLR